MVEGGLAEADSRIEGWFKAEFILLCNQLRHERLVDGYEREANLRTRSGRSQIDFRIWIGGHAYLVELKALCISQAAGTPRNLDFYFRDDHVKLIKDFRKLEAFADRHLWVLGFVYPRPDLRPGRRILDLLDHGLRRWRCITNPEDFPPYVFISAWKADALPSGVSEVKF